MQAIRNAKRRSLKSGSDHRTILGAGEPALRQFWGEERCEAEPEDLSGKRRRSQSGDPASATPSDSPVCSAHAEFVAVLVGQPPRTIPLMADAIDLEDRADHLGQVFWALSVYVAVILDDTAQNVPGNLDLRDAEGVLADLSSDLTGAIRRAADDMAGRPA